MFPLPPITSRAQVTEAPTLALVLSGKQAICSPLDVKSFGSKKVASQVASQVSSTNSSSNVSKESSASSTTSASPFRIAYPINDVDISTVKYTQKTPAAQAYIPESSPNYANPSSFSFDFGSLKQGIYNFLST
jgi:hypothetical protein